MLNFVNRIIVTVVLVVLCLLLIATAVTPEGTASFFAFQLGQIQVPPISLVHLFIAIGCFLLVVVCAIVLRLEWRRGSTRAVRLTGEGSTELATQSVVERLRHDVETIPQVRQVSPFIVGRGNMVDVVLNVRTESNVDVPTKANEIDQVARDSMARLGLKLGKLRVKIEVARGASAPPTSSPS